MFLGNSIVLAALLGFDFDFFWVAVFRPYSLLCYGIMALWLGVGLQVVLDWLSSKFARGPSLKTVMAVLVGAAMVAWSVYAHWRANDRSDSDFAEHYADMQFGCSARRRGFVRFWRCNRDRWAIINTSRTAVQMSRCTIFRDSYMANASTIHFLPKENKVEVLEQLTDSTERPLFFPLDFDIFPNRQGRIFGFLNGGG